MKRITSESEQDTLTIGIQIGRTAMPGCFIALSGDLGAGKSVLARGIARGLGIKATVQSPTFTLLNVYEEGRLPLYHFDAYRLEGEDAFEALGYEDCFYGAGVTVLEWPECVKALLPESRLDINIAYGQAPLHRTICLTPHGEGPKRIVEEAFS